MADIAIEPMTRPFSARLSPPGSKSLTNRALVLGALGDGVSKISNVLFAADTEVMLDALGQLGFMLQIDRERRVVSIGGRKGSVPSGSADIFCGNSGTTIRFLTALCALGRGTYTLDGIARMRQRPIEELGELLGHLGARVEYPLQAGFPPIRIHADRLPGGLARYHSAKSSQFLSAVLQAAPYARHEVRIDLVGPQTSWPYVAMTMRLMDEFGHTPELIRDRDTGEPQTIIIPQGNYAGTNYRVEPDASNATYFLGVAAIHPGSSVTIKGLGKRSLQGDVEFATLLAKMGARAEVAEDSVSIHAPDRLQGVYADLSSMPDTAQTLAVVALFADGQTTLRGLHTLRVKETDRVAALAAELTKLGANVSVEGDDLIIDPPKNLSPARIATYDDHRMAMSFAIAGTKAPGIVILDAECVNKTYPEFFIDLEKLSVSQRA